MESNINPGVDELFATQERGISHLMMDMVFDTSAPPAKDNFTGSKALEEIHITAFFIRKETYFYIIAPFLQNCSVSQVRVECMEFHASARDRRAWNYPASFHIKEKLQADLTGTVSDMEITSGRRYHALSLMNRQRVKWWQQLHHIMINCLP